MKNVYKEVEEIIRNKMTTEQFWKWVSEWKDPEMLINEVLNWDEELLKETLLELKAIIK